MNLLKVFGLDDDEDLQQMLCSYIRKQIKYKYFKRIKDYLQHYFFESLITAYLSVMEVYV